MFNIQMKPPVYDPEAVQPMRDELLYAGFEEMTTPQQVEDIISKKDDKTVLVFLNSVCGCAAGSARPGVVKALQNSIIPDRLTTSFAGQDRDAVDYLREKYLNHVAPSSPFIALFKNGEAIFTMPRYRIEGISPEEIAEELASVFNEKCGAKGPSISPEKFAKLEHFISCGSKIPLNEN